MNPSLDRDLGFVLGRRSDFQNFQVLGAFKPVMQDGERLQTAVAGSKEMLLRPRVSISLHITNRLDPVLKCVNHLKPEHVGC